jgi:hypothetical protein
MEVEAAGFCRNCGKAMCAECKREVQGALYCETCLAQLVTRPAAGGPSPGVALVLGFVPGLGAIYNNQFLKAAIHFAIFAGLVTVLNSDAGGLEPLFGITLAALFVYMPIDAYKTAKARLEGRSYQGPLDQLTGDQPIGAYVLIGLGVMFLLHTFHVISVGRLIGRGWPIILIVIGILMLRGRMQRTRPTEEKKQDG